ncbi:ABC transporter substrate-binding protein [Actinomadura latina]|uniref:ABC transporter substrate-binding protein n=1 Tax=Actinomadura latina TaxID=163603 RepID=A0A846Z5U3_9ACTN|nr:ABC transporter substrate-binding protein [Actinomadura latina]NKZ07197.1 ABC transporter substrate-binding protein [Actinomadura latina]
MTPNSRWMRLLVASTGLVTLAACSGVNSAGNSPSSSDSAACGQTTGITDKSIDLGVLTDLSGPVAAGGVPFSQGVQAFFDYANQKLGGVDGRQVKLAVKDHAYDPQKAVQAYRELSSKVAGIPLSFGSAATSAVAAQIVTDCMPLVANNASELDRKDGVFYSGSTYEDNTINGIDWYINDAGHKNPKVALFYQADSYGQGAKSALEFAAGRLGFKIVTAQSYAATDKSFSGQLSSIKAAKPDVVIMASTVGATFGFFGEAQSAGANWDWLGLQPTFAPAVFGLPISDAFQKKVTIAYGGPVTAIGGEQIDLAREQLKKDFPDSVDNPPALIGWTAAYIFYNALTKAAKAGQLTRGGIRDALASLEVPSKGLGPDLLKFDPASKTAGVPHHADTIVTVDRSTRGFLKVVKPWFTSGLIDDYYSSTKH